MQVGLIRVWDKTAPHPIYIYICSSKNTLVSPILITNFPPPFLFTKLRPPSLLIPRSLLGSRSCFVSFLLPHPYASSSPTVHHCTFPFLSPSQSCGLLPFGSLDPFQKLLCLLSFSSPIYLFLTHRTPSRRTFAPVLLLLRDHIVLVCRRYRWGAILFH